MRVLVSIVNYNTKDLTEDCLESVFSSKYENEIEIWVVDNASNDGSVDLIKRKFPKVKLIENKENIGFGAAHNLVLSKLNVDYFLVLNSDTLVDGGVIDAMVSFMESNENCGVASCKILGFDKKLQPNAGDLPLGWALVNWLFNLEMFGVKKSLHRNEAEYYSKISEVGWVSGNFMMIREGAIKKVGGFNEQFFMYFEDVEFCYRVRKAGLKVMINPEVFIKHLSGGSGDDPKLRQWQGEYKGLILFYKKHFWEGLALIIKVLALFSIVLRIIAFVILGKYKFALMYGKIIKSL